tara:strand:- start:1939 stop:2403 length:465 start_codon:yes stop_codon:yes gene_type:complete
MLENTYPFIKDMPPQEMAVWLMAQHITNAFGSAYVRKAGNNLLLMEQRPSFVRWAEGVRFTSADDYPNEKIYVCHAETFNKTKPACVYILNHSMTYFLRLNAWTSKSWERRKHKNDAGQYYTALWAAKNLCECYPLGAKPVWKRSRQKNQNKNQ